MNLQFRVAVCALMCCSAMACSSAESENWGEEGVDTALAAQAARDVSVEALQNESLSEHPSVGTLVRLSGVVMTTGVANKSFWVAEDAGPYHGIMVYTGSLSTSNLSQGTSVTIVGEYTEYYGKSEIKAQQISVGSRGSIPSAENDGVQSICTTCAASVPFEGVLITLHDLVVSNASAGQGQAIVRSASGAELVVDDDFVNLSLKNADEIKSLTGVLDYASSKFRILPRSALDLDLELDDTQVDPPSSEDGPCGGVAPVSKFRQCLVDLVSGHTSLGYDNARKKLFSVVDNDSGRVQCVYTGEWVKTSGIPSNNVMNVEHTWCQSWGADSGAKEADLHHLFPTMSRANSTRGNLPFGMVEKVSWSQGGSEMGTTATGSKAFEVRPQNRGNSARAIFYFAIRYGYHVEAGHEATLRAWHDEDPPDEGERSRNDRVEALQHNRNPFVDFPAYVPAIDDF